VEESLRGEAFLLAITLIGGLQDQRFWESECFRLPAAATCVSQSCKALADVIQLDISAKIWVKTNESVGLLARGLFHHDYCA
jgi:hypothetical protein